MATTQIVLDIARTELFVASFNMFGGIKKVAKLVQKLNLKWSSDKDSDVAKISAIKQTYRLGAVAHILDAAVMNEQGEIDAQATYDKMQAHAEKTVEERGVKIHNAFRMADSYWSRIAALAGKPAEKKGGGKRKSETNNDITPDNEKDVAPLAHVRKPEKYEDAVTFALGMRDIFDKFLAMNQEKVKLGEVGTLIMAYCQGCATLNKETKEPTKTREKVNA